MPSDLEDLVEYADEISEVDTEDTQELLHKKEKLFQWWVKHNGSPKMSWPGVVGDWPYRADCSVRFHSPFYTIQVPYKKKFRETRSFGPYDPLRVILFLDNNGFVAKCPRVG